MIVEVFDGHLVDGNSSNEGVVELHMRNKYFKAEEIVWLRICSGDWWDAQNAAAVCRHLGLPYNNPRPGSRSVQANGTKALTWLENVWCASCSEKEADLGRDCTYITTFSCHQEASVLCAEGMFLVNVHLQVAWKDENQSHF